MDVDASKPTTSDETSHIMENQEVSNQQVETTEKETTPEIPEEKMPLYFTCERCKLREEYEYFGREPPYTKTFTFNEDCYIIEDPFQPPRQGEFIILGAHCQDCNKTVCRDPTCSFYYNGTFCVPCAKSKKYSFPIALQEKLNKVV